MSSVNKIKGKFVIFIITFLILGIFPEFLFIYSKYRDYEKERDLYITQQHDILDYYQAEVDLRYGQVFSDLAFLSSSSDFVNYLHNKSDLKTLQNNWALFSETNKNYDQIRYLDKKGNELIRINYNNGKPYIVPDSELQNKMDRYYFSDLLKYNEPTIIVSIVDLNIEHNEIEIPHKPVIRFSLPLFDNNDEFDGAIILNYYAANLLDNLKDKLTAIQSNLFVLNENGYILTGPDAKQLWGFMFKDKKNSTFKNITGIDLLSEEVTRKNYYFSDIGLIVHRTIQAESQLVLERIKKHFKNYNIRLPLK